MDKDELAILFGIFTSSRASCNSSQADCFPGSISFEEFSASIVGEEVHIAETAGTVAGFVSVWVQDSFVHHLYVLPEQQAKGVGSMLLEFCASRYSLPLSLKCTTANLLARNFYRHKGWVAHGETGSNADGPWERLQSALE